jgi:hypothetical protein
MDTVKIVELLVSHQWKGFTKDGAFKCKAGCVVDLVGLVPSRLEAQHQADILAASGLGETA